MEQEDDHVYDAIVRVRDDLYILKPVDWSNIFHALLEKKYSILAPNYGSPGFAPSDKIAFISSNAMNAYFRGPLVVYYLFPALLWGEKDSSSTFEEELNRSFWRISTMVGDCDRSGFPGDIALAFTSP